MRTDVHAHYWTDDYLDLMAGSAKPIPRRSEAPAPAAEQNSTPG
jgi:hypothetical protein